MSRQLVPASWTESYAGASRVLGGAGTQPGILGTEPGLSGRGQHLGSPGARNLAVAQGQMLKCPAFQAQEFGLDSEGSGCS